MKTHATHKSVAKKGESIYMRQSQLSGQMSNAINCTVAKKVLHAKFRTDD